MDARLTVDRLGTKLINDGSKCGGRILYENANRGYLFRKITWDQNSAGGTGPDLRKVFSVPVKSEVVGLSFIGRGKTLNNDALST